MITPIVRVAVVDDDDAVLESLCLLLEAEGYSAEPFASAAEFLQALGPDRFDCLILDQHMPGLTGLELARQLRAAGNHLPIMLISGALTPELARKATAMDMLNVAEKPLREGQLMRFVEGARAA